MNRVKDDRPDCFGNLQTVFSDGRERTPPIAGRMPGMFP